MVTGSGVKCHIIELYSYIVVKLVDKKGGQFNYDWSSVKTKKETRHCVYVHVLIYIYLHVHVRGTHHLEQSLVLVHSVNLIESLNNRGK